ncbi:MAG: hypothetical protein WA268_26550 [Xanthobacteraceae bacterium]
MTKPRKFLRKLAISGRTVTIYDGRGHTASIIGDEAGYTLCDAHGNWLGYFESCESALRFAHWLMPPVRTGGRR